jgi:hypothetical protein
MKRIHDIYRPEEERKIEVEGSDPIGGVKVVE